MNLPARPRHFPRLSPELLRPKFWEVAMDERDMRYITPFQKARIEKGYAIEGLAASMGMEIHQYTDFENGFTRPNVKDILGFCMATKIHPLDLYVSDKRDIPLPQEIVAALVDIAGRGDEAGMDRRRASARLRQEAACAYAMVHEHSVDFRPMFVALGISPDSQRCNAPLYIPADFTDTICRTMPEEDEPVFIKIMKVSRENTVRGFIDKCLNAYDLMLAGECRDRLATHQRIGAMRDRTLTALSRTAASLFGEDGKQAAADNILNMIRTTKDRLALKSRIMNNPSLVGDGCSDVKSSQVLAFFTAALHEVEYEALYDRNNPAKRLEEAKMRYDSFKCWRDRPHTQRMIDWFENLVTLQYKHPDLLENREPVAALEKDRTPQ